MKTKTQEALVNSFLEAVDGEIRPIYQGLITSLVELGYNPKKEKSSISFKHDAHGKQIAKLRMDKGAPYFALRFSACSGYSKRFADIIAAWMAKYPTRVAVCPDGKCNYCSGEPTTHVYAHDINGERKAHCGAYAVEIPSLAVGDVEELKALIHQEHMYLMKHEAEAAV